MNNFYSQIWGAQNYLDELTIINQTDKSDSLHLDIVHIINDISQS